MRPDIRALLKEADKLHRSGAHAQALHLYARAARFFVSEGWPLKAVAVFRQIRQIIRDQALDERELDDEARWTMVELFRVLGLPADARALEAEARTDRSNPRLH